LRQYKPDAPPVAGQPVSRDLLAQARRSLDGRQRGLRGMLPFLGPAFIACVAYIDPGNFATNIAGGSAFGYNLLWVILTANLVAILMQTLSAKLGIASGQNLAEACRTYFPRPMVYGMWILAEVGAMATDLAEFLGASLGIYLLFHIPLLPAALITGVATVGMLALQRRGVRPLEILIAGLVGVIAVCYLVETFLSKPDWGQVAFHSVVPYVVPDSILISVGILGATVMPHVIYLHSALTQNRITPRNEAEAKRIFRFTIPDIVLAMGLAGLINMAMLYMAAATFHAHGLTDIASIESAHQTLAPLLGGAASTVFAVSLLASGLSSSTVGTMAGQVIMQGFVGFTIPLWLRRLVTMLPAIVVIAIGANPTLALVLSQVVLSMVLPLPVLTLVYLTTRRDVMGSLVNRRVTTVVASMAAAAIVALNVLLLAQTAGLRLPASG
jgi:manganese transport protein